jgi:hypothetical protein
LGIRYSNLLRILSIVFYERLKFPQLSQESKEKFFDKHINEYEELFGKKSLVADSLKRLS